MAVFAILNNQIVENTVVFEESKIDEMVVIFPNKDIVLVTDENAPTGVSIDDDIYKGKFRRKSPYSSWTFNEEIWQWEAPTPYPRDGIPYIWNEESLSWTPIAE